MLNLVMDHNERQCASEYNNECYYTVVVLGNGKDEEYAKYTLSVMHSQENY